MEVGKQEKDFHVFVPLCHLTIEIMYGKLRKVENMSNKIGKGRQTYEEMNSRKLKKFNSFP